jgi:hypothetical protein
MKQSKRSRTAVINKKKDLQQPKWDNDLKISVFCISQLIPKRITFTTMPQHNMQNKLGTWDVDGLLQLHIQPSIKWHLPIP